MDMKFLVMIFFAVVIVLTLISLIMPELPFGISVNLAALIIIFSIAVIVIIWFSRNKSYYPY